MFEHVTDDIEKLIVRFPGGMGEVNCYLIKGESGYTVIDTGTYANESIDLWETVLESGVLVEKVVLTHTHQDHIGLARWFQESIGVPVFTSKLGYMEMLKARNFKNKKEKLDSLIKRHGGTGIPKRLDNDAFIYDFEPDGFFEENDNIQLGNDFYEVIWVPGHAPDQYIFYQRDKKILIVGDHILKDISPVIGLWLGEESNLLKEYYDSLEKMTQFPAVIALPGHGPEITNLEARVQDIKDKHDYRLEQILEHITDQGKTANELSKEIYASLNMSVFISPFMATLTRLIYLESLGEIHRVEKNGLICFSR
ncbi:MBL fold metallo-hydrolase [Oceanobacillus damuensis]|uniref:MBL fold metallo-hydrolase n=1 Tax=Oceanobacillus damuensis TaxID=937928 RepID=UPI00082EDF5A|nr:MBL fold metallo-hydrolase [Oceanobacillus damuensis]